MRGLLCERSWVWHPIVTSYPCFDSFAFTYRVYKTDSLRFLSQMMTNRTTDVKSLWYLYLSFVNCRFEILILQLQKQQEELIRKRAAGHHWIKKKEKIRRSFGGKFVLFNTVQGFFNFVRTIQNWTLTKDYPSVCSTDTSLFRKVVVSFLWEFCFNGVSCHHLGFVFHLMRSASPSSSCSLLGNQNDVRKQVRKINGSVKDFGKLPSNPRNDPNTLLYSFFLAVLFQAPR